MSESHRFETFLHWPADAAQALLPAADYSRNSVLSAAGKADVAASAPTVFGGDESRYNPEELLLLALSQCHMLTYLAMAVRRGITVLDYADQVTGSLGAAVSAELRGKMSMREVTLRPRVTVAKGSDLEAAMAMHEKAHANCFIANSVNFPVTHQAEIIER